MRAWWRGLAVVVITTSVAGGSTAVAQETERLSGGDAARSPAATTIVPMPDLGIAHRLPSGAMNLWRMPLSEVEEGFGQPALVKNLDYGGFSYGNSRTVVGDFADVTASDDGTADHVIWHAQPNGGVLLWAVGGGADTTPRIWQDLRTGGWSWADSRPIAGDVNGDGWDDLVVRHRLGTYGTNVWVFLSNGSRLGAPLLWFQESESHLGLDQTRHLLMDVNADGRDDWVFVQPTWWRNGPRGIFVFARLSTGSYFVSHESYSGVTALGIFTEYEDRGGWSFANSRQLAADVSGDGRDDLVTIHSQPGGGILAWGHVNCYVSGSWPCIQTPTVWQDLRTGGWSFAGSRQHLADTDADGRDDLISLHSQSGNPGILVWRHRSTGAGLSSPQIVTDLRTGGWSYSASREGVADTYGVVTTP